MGVLNFPIISWFWLLIKSIIGILSRLYCRTRRKSLAVVDDGPISITIGDPSITKDRTLSHMSQKPSLDGEENKFVDWNTWKDNSTMESCNDPSTNHDHENLFEDMEPKLTKPKMVRIARNMAGPKQKETYHLQNRLHVDTNAMHVQTELGTWVDDQPGWDNDLVEESEISEEAQNILREKRKAEKQRRADEQKRKKEEQRLVRADKKSAHLGIKVN